MAILRGQEASPLAPARRSSCISGVNHGTTDELGGQVAADGRSVGEVVGTQHFLKLEARVRIEQLALMCNQ